MKTRSLLPFLLLAFSFFLCGSASAQALPFSYRGVYEATLTSGAKIVFYVRKDADVRFGYINTNTQTVAMNQFTVPANGSFTFSTTAGSVSGTFTATGVTGFVAGQSFNAPRQVFNSTQGSLQGGYSGTLWFQADGSLNAAEFVLTPGGKLYALADTVYGLQGAVGTYAANGTFTATGVPGNVALSGSGTVTDGVFSGSYSTPTGTVYFDGGRENLSYRMANLSTRGNVGTGANQMIAGFVIKNGAKRVLIRAMGPSLTPLGVPGALNDPAITLFSGPTVIATNDNWQTGNDVAAIQATGFAPSDTRESVLLVTLEEGPYTAIVSGAGGTTGVALVEVYEID
ncbi:hypothetical protein AYO41_05165 [Verrucomicrobia bacterium SCGC AG-212-E04]|nr:hypothetical protein AYO41_05165 [Verrucomicrobia bacterium SCGC AG-212-E04]